jgi:transcriptional regulator with XRE-family HTH domain
MTTEGKGNAAVGAYIERLRERQRLTKTEVASKAGTDISGLGRIESGESDTRYTLLMTVIRVVNGNPDHVFALTERKDTPREEGIRLADEWIDKPRAQRTIEDLVSEFGPEILEILNGLGPEPRSLGEWIGYGRALRRRTTN